jgi:hypothetical protein
VFKTSRNKKVMKKEFILIGGGVIIAILLIWISIELDNKNRLKEESQALKRDRLKLIKEYLKIAREIPSEIKAQIEKLVVEYEDIDTNVAKELLDVLNLIEQKMESKAIAALAKVIENLLKDKYAEKILVGKYSDQEDFIKKKSKITFFKVAEFAKNDNFLSEHEYNLTNLLRDFRNKSSHELGVEIGKNWQTIAFLTGIEIVFKLKGKKAA